MRMIFRRNTNPRPHRAATITATAAFMLFWVFLAIGPPRAVAQVPIGNPAEMGPAAAPGGTAVSTEQLSTKPKTKDDRDTLLQKVLKGGPLMIPIAILSLLVVTFGLERLLALRRSKVLPEELIDGLGHLSRQKGGLDPRKAFKACQEYPSAAASVIKAMLLKVGRPHSELENAVAEAREREATRLYANVRWLVLAATIAPLIGLLGTVWGISVAFDDLVRMDEGQRGSQAVATSVIDDPAMNPQVVNTPESKAKKLAKGITIALMTTVAGLVVAIPAAILAHACEGRIQSLFMSLDEVMLGLMPQLERYEGRIRVSHDQMMAPETPAQRSPAGRTQAPVVAPTAAPAKQQAAPTGQPPRPATETGKS